MLLCRLTFSFLTLSDGGRGRGRYPLRGIRRWRSLKGDEDPQQSRRARERQLASFALTTYWCWPGPRQSVGKWVGKLHEIFLEFHPGSLTPASFTLFHVQSNYVQVTCFLHSTLVGQILLHPHLCQILSPSREIKGRHHCWTMRRAKHVDLGSTVCRVLTTITIIVDSGKQRRRWRRGV
jgi:hypothetical protein